MIELDISARKLLLEVSDTDLQKCQEGWQAPPYPATRGYTAVFAQHVTQANEGCDFDFFHASD